MTKYSQMVLNKLDYVKCCFSNVWNIPNVNGKRSFIPGPGDEAQRKTFLLPLNVLD